MKLALRKVNAPDLGRFERLLGRLIDWGTGSAGYFHCEILFSDGMSFTADPCQGSVIWRHDFAPGGWTFYDLGDEDEPAARRYARRHADTHSEPYDLFGAIACSPVGRLLFPWVRHWRAHLYCSLACYATMRASGCCFPPARRGRRFRVSPNDLARAAATSALRCFRTDP